MENTLYQRWNIHHRLQHACLFTSFITLTITGIPIKYAYSGWAQTMSSFMGGFDLMFKIHLAAGALMAFTAFYHLSYLLICLVLRKDLSLAAMPSWKDFRDLYHHIFFCLGLRDKDANFGRYTYMEKFDYWAVFWGMAIMVGSGFIMWFPHISAKYFSRVFIDATQVAHSDEAMLAIIAVFIWHFFNAHFSPKIFPSNWTWLTGKVSHEEMVEFHADELTNNPPPTLSAEGQLLGTRSFSWRENIYYIIFLMIIYTLVLVWFLKAFLPLGFM